jgi:spore maturation protein CgeB
MKWLIVHTDYPGFLNWHYGRNPDISKHCFSEQLSERYKTLFGVADSYSHGLRSLGHEVLEVFVNNEPMQRLWCREHNVTLPPSVVRNLRWRRGVFPWLCRQRREIWQTKAFHAQGELFKPDVILNFDMFLPEDFLRSEWAKEAKLVGQHAATRLPYDRNWSIYDLVISSFPATVDWFRRRQVDCVYSKLAFDPRMLGILTPEQKQYPITFVGSLQPVHSTRLQLLETVCDTFDDFLWWGPDATLVPKDSPLHARYQGPAWGAEMYRVLSASEITINEHGAIPAYANNYRLYEATGVVTCIVTDWKENLETLFTPEQEVVSYKTPAECVAKLQALRHDLTVRQAIAKRGQQRTLREHTFSDRIHQLIEWVESNALLG